MTASARERIFETLYLYYTTLYMASYGFLQCLSAQSDAIGIGSLVIPISLYFPPPN